ncbi:MAG: acyl-CoA synthetase [Gammaproteobacteria bacterium]|nr:acyl-CoA synthetase [Gammaproteobacteria bacterium]MDE0412834.1 acyl-CoA synthetase [Gammaproteobacteria bacterium]
MAIEAFPALHEANDRVALIDGESSWSYRELNARIDRCAAGLLNGKNDLHEERVAVFAPAGLDYVTALHGVWRAGGIAVPLNVGATAPEIEYYFRKAGVTRVIASRQQLVATDPVCRRLSMEVLEVNDLLGTSRQQRPLPAVERSRPAMIVFTSGTTSKPKGAVITHKAILAQVTTLIKAWRWTRKDSIPLFLPLHHLHGIINVLSCALWCGATVHASPKLDVARLCEQAGSGAFSVFMAVPTVYVKLMEHIESLAAPQRRAVCRGFGRMRLNVSGSAACPVRVFERWKKLTGQTLLERYGATETGMTISNPYDGVRRAGFVGQVLPGVRAQLFDDNHRPVRNDATPGEIRIRSDGVFQGYWDDERASRASFHDGWFRTGDIAVVEDGYYRILGRSSIDIIKSGGYKLSALEIEGVLLDHEAIGEASVIGLPDDTWGEVVAAAVTLKDGASLDLAGLKHWCAGRMSAYKIPKRLKVLNDLPRNAMGKVVKPALRDLL